MKTTGIGFSGVFGQNNLIACNSTLQDYPNTVDSTDNITDQISLYDSSGVATSPIMIVGNKLKGSGSWDVGSAFVIADGNIGTSYAAIINNVLVSAAQESGGVGLAGGSQIVVQNNRVINSLSSTKHWSPFFLMKFTPPTVVCDNIIFDNKQSNWLNHADTDQTVTSIWLKGSNGNCTNVSTTVPGYSLRHPALSEATYDTNVPKACASLPLQ